MSLPPLYQSHQAPMNKEGLSAAHAGLWFDRFFNQYGQDWTLSEDSKKEWINTSTGSVGSAQKLAAHNHRQTALSLQLQGKSERFKNNWHWISGMGNPHPVENSLSWHPTLGVPFLAGSAVKGLIRAWVELNDDDLSEGDKKKRLMSWFGTEKKEDVADKAGDFIFFDAIPDECPRLIADIMTPHMGEWYAKGDKSKASSSDTVPADWHDPIPIPFLAVNHIALVFNIAPRSTSIKDAEQQLEDIFCALEQALLWLGAGAKTASGYGYMDKDDSFAKQLLKEKVQAEKQQRLDKLSPEQQQIELLREALQEKQETQQKEVIGGLLHQKLKQCVDEAAEWSNEDKQILWGVGDDILRYLSEGKKLSKKSKALLNTLR